MRRQSGALARGDSNRDARPRSGRLRAVGAGDGRRRGHRRRARASLRAGARSRGSPRRLPVCRIWDPRLAPDLRRRPRGAGRRSAEGGLRPRIAAGRRGAVVPAGLVPPASRSERLATRILDRDRRRAPAGRPRHRQRRPAAPDLRLAVRAPRGGADLASRDRPDSAVPARQRRAGEHPCRSLDHVASVRRRSRDAARAVCAARHRRDPGAARARHRSRRDPSERGSRGAGSARAGARADGRRRRLRDGLGRSPQADRLHDPHAGRGGERQLRAGARAVGPR